MDQVSSSVSLSKSKRFLVRLATICKFGTIIALVIGVVFVGVWILYPAALKDMASVNTNSLNLSTEEVKLGQVGLGEERKLSVEITNASKRTLTFLAPEADCGCISTSIQPEQIRPGETASLRTTIRTPLIAQSIRRSIAIRVKENQNITWNVTISASCEAEFWCSPNRIDAETSSDQSGRFIIEVHHKPNLDYNTLSELNKGYSLEKIATTNGLTKYAITFSTAEGTSVITFKECVSEQVLASIPVTWKKEGKIKIVPSTLNVVRNNSIENHITANLVILTKGMNSSGSIKVESKQKWIKLLKVNHLGKRIQLSVEIDTTAAPRNFAGPILEAYDEESRAVATLYMNDDHEHEN